LVALLLIVAVFFFPLKALSSQLNAENATNYSLENISSLENIQDDLEALSDVREISWVSKNREQSDEIQKNLNLIKKCPNLANLYIEAQGVNVDSSFLNELPSSLHVIWFTEVNVDFHNVHNDNITTLRMDGGNLSNYAEIIGLSNLNDLGIFAASGVTMADYENLSHLTDLKLKGVSIDNYQELFAKLQRVKYLNLTYSNLQDVDTKYFEILPQLEKLFLLGTYVENISFLNYLPKLEILVLPMGVTDLSPIYSLKKLKAIDYDAYTLMNVDISMIKYFQDKNISYPQYNLSTVEKVNNIVSDFNFDSNTTDFEKVDKVSSYVVNHMEYQKATIDVSLDFVVKYEMGVCNEYALLEYTLLKLVGVEAYFVAGYGNTSFPVDSFVSRVPHAWNMVRIEGNWYALDVTWVDDADDYYINAYYMVPSTTSITWKDFYTNPDLYCADLFGLTHVTFNSPQENITEAYSNEEDGVANSKVSEARVSSPSSSYVERFWVYWLLAGIGVSTILGVSLVALKKTK